MRKFIKYLSLLSIVMLLGGMIASMLCHGDDVVRHLDFQKVKCAECGGDGQTWSGTCDVCSGDGYVYKIKSK